MTSEDLDQLQQRLGSFDSRIINLEQKAAKESQGVWSKVSRSALLIGVVGGIIGGTNTIWGLWNQWNPMPVLKPVIGGDLSIHMAPENQDVVFNYALAIDNRGTSSGWLTRYRVYLIRYEDDTAQVELGRASLQIEALRENRTPLILPVGLRAGEYRGVELSVKKDRRSEADLKFPTEGMHSILLEFDTEARPVQIRYCFWIGKYNNDQLLKDGLITYGSPDARCKERTE